MVGTHNYTFAQTHRTSNTKSAPQRKLCTWGEDTGSSVVTNGPSAGDVDGGGALGVAGGGAGGQSSQEHLC